MQNTQGSKNKHRDIKTTKQNKQTAKRNKTRTPHHHHAATPYKTRSQVASKRRYHRLRQVPLEAARDLSVKIAPNQVRRVTTTSTLQLRPLANSLVHRLSCPSSRLPSQRNKVNAFLLANLKRLQQFPVMSIRSCHTALVHRNFNIFFLQRMRDCDVKR